MFLQAVIPFTSSSHEGPLNYTQKFGVQHLPTHSSLGDEQHPGQPKQLSVGGSRDTGPSVLNQ